MFFPLKHCGKSFPGDINDPRFPEENVNAEGEGDGFGRRRIAGTASEDERRWAELRWSRWCLSDYSSQDDDDLFPPPSSLMEILDTSTEDWVKVESVDVPHGRACQSSSI
jgi:hypothetical protein